jgi:membrane protein
MNPRRFCQLIKQAAISWSDNNATTYGASLAYYAIFSLAPLLFLTIDMASLLVGENAARSGIIDQIRQTVGASTANAVAAVLDGATQTGGHAGITVLGLVLLLLGASGVYVELQEALNLIWKTEAPPRIGSAVIHFIKHRLLSFTAVLGTGVLLLLSLIVSSVLAAISHWMTSFPGSIFLWQGLALLVSFAFVTMLFALIFKLLPDAPIAWADVWIGSLLTSVLFTLGQQLIGVYLGQSGVASAYGAAGSLAALLVWVYYSAQIVLFGAEFTHAFALTQGSCSPSRQNGAKVASPKPSQVA